MSKKFIYITVGFYIVSSLLGALVLIITMPWSFSLNWSNKLVIFYVYIVVSALSILLNTIYFKKRGMKLPFIGTLILGLTSLPLIYFMYIDKPSLFSPNNFLPFLGIAYLGAYLFYALSFIIPIEVKKYSLLRTYGITNLLLLAFTLITNFVYIPYWQKIILVFGLFSNVLLVLHFLREQDHIEMEDETILDLDF